MKAAVLFPDGNGLKYVDFPEPIPESNDQLLITVKAAAIKQLDRALASGTHYSGKRGTQLPKVIGGDGVGILEDGTRIYALGVSGMMAEKAIAEKSRMIPLPPALDDITAAALPNAVAGSSMALLFRAGIQAGHNVLINGATGFTGKIAVQLARYYGAGKIIGTGRNETSLASLHDMGVDETISLRQPDSLIQSQLKALHSRTPIDIIIDYLWGHPAEIILETFRGSGSYIHKIKYISVGSMAGESIQLSSAILRSVDLQISGSGIGSWTREEMQKLFVQIIPEMFQLAVENKLKVDTFQIPLNEIEKIWEMPVPDGKRLVITI